MHHPVLSKCLERRILNEFVNNVERVTDDLIVCIFLAIDSRVFYIGLWKWGWFVETLWSRKVYWSDVGEFKEFCKVSTGSESFFGMVTTCWANFHFLFLDGWRFERWGKRWVRWLYFQVEDVKKVEEVKYTQTSRCIGKKEI